MTAKLKCLFTVALPATVLALGTWDAIAGSQKQSSEVDNAPTGEQLWANNCQRCHNIRPPQTYTPVQWQIIVHHMRVRANLTGADARAITEFLTSASH